MQISAPVSPASVGQTQPQAQAQPQAQPQSPPKDQTQTQQSSKPASPEAAKAEAAAQAKKLADFLATPTVKASAKVVESLAAVSKMTIGGGTKEGAAAAVKAAALLSQASIFTQIAGRNAASSKISPQMEMNLMMLSTQLAGQSAQIMMGAQAAKPIDLSTVLAEPAKKGVAILSALVEHVSKSEQAAANPSPAGYL